MSDARTPAPESSAYSIFQQPWWLEATAPGHWDAVEIEEGGRTVARLPFVVTKRLGLRMLGQPALTQALGPWMQPTPGGHSKRLAREKDLYTRLITGLPAHDIFRQNFHGEVTNWLPFHWQGFTQTTRYSYVLDGLRNPAQLLAGFSKTTRNLVRQAERVVEVTESDDVEDVLRLAEKTFQRQGKTLPYSPDLLRRIDAAATRHGQRRALVARDDQGRAHAAAYIVGDQARAYLLVTGADPELRRSGAGNLVHWRAIQAAAEFTDIFDFEGSMLEPVEEFYRKFGAVQSPYSFVSRSSGAGALAFEAWRMLRR
ncbi:GNAT family N-acetyltransferase [Microbacterium sp. PMB16]|uniref:GNAT family N-acetyltransferase n=1 Tax=Microbacterium sp. PMB16 TaxID=3120157 RepID=UPI003F4B5A0A